jgi:hypothetical protein
VGSNPTAVNSFFFFCSFVLFTSPERFEATKEEESMARTRIITNRFESRFLIRFLESPTLFASCFTSSRSLQTLAYEEVRTSGDRESESTALILHGLLGSGRNWRSFSRSLASSLSVSSASGTLLSVISILSFSFDISIEISCVCTFRLEDDIG